MNMVAHQEFSSKDVSSDKLDDTGIVELLQNQTPQISSFELSKAVTFSKFFGKVKLSPSAKLVLRCLIDFWNPKKGLVYPGQDVISDATGVSKRSVISAVEELRQSGFLLTVRKSSHLNYYFTQNFFEHLGLNFFGSAKISPVISKNFTSCCEKTAHPCHEHVREHENNKKKDFQKVFAFQKYEKNYQAKDQGINYQPYKPENNQRDEKSPYTDKECAIQWIQSLGNDELKHSFIRERVEKIRKLWNLETETTA